MQRQTLESVFDELEKIGASMRSAGYMQSRRGTRSLRVDTLLNRGAQQDTPTTSSVEQDMQAPEVDQPEPAQVAQDDAGEGTSVGKVASKSKSDKALEAFSEVRPYAVSGLKAGIPAAFFMKTMVPSSAGAARTAGLVGAGLGMGNEYLERWAEKNKRKAVAKKILQG